ncbi:MAG: hypothetical protein A3G87_04580 [Omnitrophica bacterium RIFCSPLOWO2_12_FULL_50_11]|nr:MAG: hypothetical protein A3G87_04580 [Omnitrophica bacterium RIFCSPLOWO2_12_FULL_50_11]
MTSLVSMNRFVVVLLAVLLSGVHPTVTYAEPSPEMLREFIRAYLAQQEKLQGAFAIVDPRTGGLRRLELVRVHERVGKTGDYYYSCTDMKDVQTGDLLDLDFDVEDLGGKFGLVDIRIHKDNGSPRYTYDENDNLIPLP